MPINTPFPLVPIEQTKFAELDYDVMGHAFASQNELGHHFFDFECPAGLWLFVIGLIGSNGSINNQ